MEDGVLHQGISMFELFDSRSFLMYILMLGEFESRDRHISRGDWGGIGTYDALFTSSLVSRSWLWIQPKSAVVFFTGLAALSTLHGCVGRIISQLRCRVLWLLYWACKEVADFIFIFWNTPLVILWYKICVPQFKKISLYGLSAYCVPAYAWHSTSWSFINHLNRAIWQALDQ